MTKEKRTIILFGGVLAFLGGWIWLVCLNWKIALAVMFIMWGANLLEDNKTTKELENCIKDLEARIKVLESQKIIISREQITLPAKSVPLPYIPYQQPYFPNQYPIMIECDNISNVHNPRTIAEDENAIRVLCLECKHQYVIRKDWRGVPENKQYSKLFKRDTLQGHENLFYKVYPQYLRT